ncbi:hypothetical protein P4555_20255 [Peribacillus frigoritolerans]|uniref:hypothetical protein n=1 Tax=Peribacillus frigoritolerans TaxID=450367 RepID=UPI002E21CC46|nr:hypothetical protein [Peribacillus frigoritolerans]
MEDNFTLAHALSKNSIPELKKLSEKYNADEHINPNAGKPRLIQDLIPVIPTADREKIIDNTFNTPKTRYNAHLGVYSGSLISEDEINANCLDFNRSHDFSNSSSSYQTNQRENMELIEYDEEELLFYYTYTEKKPSYDYDSLESRPVIFSRKIRVIIKPNEGHISAFSGDRDLFNNVLTALTHVFGRAITPLNINKTGISNVVAGNFSFHTVKVIDFIYHGLDKLGVLGEIKDIELETSLKSKNPQKVKVQGNDLLDDKSICDYLFMQARDLVGVKLALKFILSEEIEHLVNIEIGIRDNRTKIGIKRDHHTLELVKFFYELLENITQKYIQEPGLINEENTVKILDQIRQRALSGS